MTTSNDGHNNNNNNPKLDVGACEQQEIRKAVLVVLGGLQCWAYLGENKTARITEIRTKKRTRETVLGIPYDRDWSNESLFAAVVGNSTVTNTRKRRRMTKNQKGNDDDGDFGREQVMTKEKKNTTRTRQKERERQKQEQPNECPRINMTINYAVAFGIFGMLVVAAG